MTSSPVTATTWCSATTATSFAEFAADDHHRADAVSIFAGVGGDDDVITLGDGDHVMLGGDGADDILAGDGDNVVFGDHGDVVRRVRRRTPPRSFAVSIFAGEGGDDFDHAG